MTERDDLKASLVSLRENPFHFEALALAVFQFQYKHNPIYKQYVNDLGRSPQKVDRLEKIPFLPIEFFKKHTIVSGPSTPSVVFESSGTTGADTSKHYVADLPLYEHLSRQTFESFYGPLTDYHIFALLPSYLERTNSSLVYMVQNFIFHAYSQESGFYLENKAELVANIKKATNSGRKILLLGVSFALLDLAEDTAASAVLKNMPNNQLIVMETGGMKGKRKELIREELHGLLCQAFGVSAIHSEYGMTELLSQGYSKADGIFKLPKSMKVLLREINDPFAYLPSFKIGTKQPATSQKNKTGGLNIIDLANIDSCSFLETKDLGCFTEDYASFKIMGRFDNSDVRGCNLLVN
jgi:phenylacetate-coenzyme A ligase PaaK-like adenylate-forming protein